jgi:hypothetical protein
VKGHGTRMDADERPDEYGWTETVAGIVIERRCRPRFPVFGPDAAALRGGLT